MTRKRHTEGQIIAVLKEAWPIRHSPSIAWGSPFDFGD
jgi:hypothetical protein